jgi:hypothetical protein
LTNTQQFRLALLQNLKSTNVSSELRLLQKLMFTEHAAKAGTPPKPDKPKHTAYTEVIYPVRTGTVHSASFWLAMIFS